MKKLWITLRIATALSTTPVFSQETQEESPLEEIPLFEPGEASVSSTQAAQSTNWQTWAVAGGALLAAAIGVALVATNTGSAADHE